MTYFYSPSAKGFFDDTFHLPNEIPEDVIQLTDKEYRFYLKAVNSNKVIKVEFGELKLSDRPVVVEDIIKSITASLQNHLDEKAKEYGYDNIYTAISYAEESSVPKFQIEGKAFREWRSLFWLNVNEIKNTVIEGSRQMPNIDELILELPKLNLPPSDLV